MITKTPGQIAYDEDCARKPTYHTGEPRPSWESLDKVTQWSWDRNPTPREWAPFVDVSTVSEYGLTQKLSNAIRVF